VNARFRLIRSAHGALFPSSNSINGVYLWYKFTIVSILAFALVAPSADKRLRHSAPPLLVVYPDECAPKFVNKKT
jgi:hypothetical protein